MTTSAHTTSTGKSPKRLSFSERRLGGMADIAKLLCETPGQYFTAEYLGVEVGLSTKQAAFYLTKLAKAEVLQVTRVPPSASQYAITPEKAQLCAEGAYNQLLYGDPRLKKQLAAEEEANTEAQEFKQKLKARGMVAVVTETAEIEQRLPFLRMLKAKTIYGANPILDAIIADYELTLELRKIAQRRAEG